jgi:hypothetical protein
VIRFQVVEEIPGQDDVKPVISIKGEKALERCSIVTPVCRPRGAKPLPGPVIILETDPGSIGRPELEVASQGRAEIKDSVQAAGFELLQESAEGQRAIGRRFI